MMLKVGKLAHDHDAANPFFEKALDRMGEF
jgi:hypothetical protein